MVLYGLLDPQGNMEYGSIVILTLSLLLLAIFSHWETGLYNKDNLAFEMYLLYCCLTVGILNSTGLQDR